MVRGFHSPESVEEAMRLKCDLGHAAVYLAGGTRVNSRNFAFEPDHVIHLGGLALDRIEETPDGLSIGACVTIQEIVEARNLPWPLRRAAVQLGNRNIRQVATLGGHVGANDPCADILPALIALDAVVLLATNSGTLEMPVSDLVCGTQALSGPGPVQAGVDEGTGDGAGLITAVRIPRPNPCRGFGLEAFTRTASDRSIVNTAVSLSRVGDKLQRPIVAVGGVGPTVVRLAQVEKVLVGAPLPSLGVIEDLVSAHVAPISDVRGSAEFKRHIAGHLVARAVVAAWQSAAGGPARASEGDRTTPAGGNGQENR